jgi:hypothetical protein
MVSVVGPRKESPVAEAPEQADSIAIDLKDPALAALLAWLIPGLGHWYQGRRAKAALYFLCILGLFSFGVYLSSSNEPCRQGGAKIGCGRAVYFSWRRDDHHLAYLCQVGVGLPALPAMLQAYRMSHRQEVRWDGFMAPPRPLGMSPDEPNFTQPTLSDLNYALKLKFDLAGLFTMVAGLLNLLAIYDAWAGPVVVLAPEKKEREEETNPSAK